MSGWLISLVFWGFFNPLAACAMVFSQHCTTPVYTPCEKCKSIDVWSVVKDCDGKIYGESCCSFFKHECGVVAISGCISRERGS